MVVVVVLVVVVVRIREKEGYGGATIYLSTYLPIRNPVRTVRMAQDKP